jgi:type VI secretion system protein ImpL
MGRQAPVRAVVVCVSSELFLGAAAQDAVTAAARSTNQMLRDLAQRLGTEVPVYVFLTKLDRIPYFSEYVGNLSNDEASQPLGMAFKRIGVSSGPYAEKAMGEITTALDQILFSLGEFRLELLARATDQKNFDPVYEFPREMRKLRNNLATYLVEVTRPSHLNVNPYLRGFYCTGVRAHVVQEAVAAAAQLPQSDPAGAGATRMFTVEQMRAAASAQTPQVVSRKQAQWCFLPRLFSNVIFEDRSALAGTSNSKRTHLLRRVAFATLSVLLLAFFACLTVSWVHNSELDDAVLSAANALPPNNVPPGTLAPTQDLATLNQLRKIVLQLEGYQHNGAPLMYRFGLYHGADVLDAARRIYFDRFRRLLLTNTQANLRAALNALPATPAAAADYSAAYNPLKAYLITTSNPDKSTPDFLAPVLTQYWKNGLVPQSQDQEPLAQQQFQFYAVELAQNNPYTIQPDNVTVIHAQSYLANFGGFERIYQQMLAGASKVAPAIDFNRLYAGSSAWVVEPHVVAGAFTSNGSKFMQDAISHPASYFSAEAWVLGNQAPPSLDSATLTQQLTARYVADFQTEWRNFLHTAYVVKFGNLQDAGNKLSVLSNPSSPLLELLFTASSNTAVAYYPNIQNEFQPAQVMVAPNSPDKLVGPGNTAYINGLLGLQAAVAQAAADPTAATNPAAMTPIISASATAHTDASQTAQAFTLDPQAHVDQMVLTLIQEPINLVDEVVRGVGPQVINGAGAAFCRSYSTVMAKFPFSPNSTVDASPAEVAQLFQPGSGAMWQFYDISLKSLLIQQGSTFVPVAGSPMHVNPDFVQFFNRAAAISADFYPSGGPGGLTFTFHFLPSTGIVIGAFSMDGQQLSSMSGSKQFTWTMASQSAQLTANALPLAQSSGPWAVFHVMAVGHLIQGGATEQLAIPLEVNNVQMSSNGTPVQLKFELSGPGASLLAPGALNLRCVPTVAH